MATMNGAKHPLFLTLLVAAALLASCIVKDPALDDDDSADECDEAESVLTPFMVEGQMWCEEEMPGNMTCFDCHLCAVSEGAEVNLQHYVCNYCHNGPNGEILDPENAGDCGCEGLDCVENTELTCDDCHTDGCNGYVSAQVQRDNCLYCHDNPDR